MISKNTVIGFLVFAAVVLGCILVMQIAAGPQAAYASIVSRSGGYAMTTALYRNDRELIWILKQKEQKLAVYGLENDRRVVALAEVDIKDIFEREEQAQPERYQRGRRRR